jgi:hypothetical protein
MDDGVDLDRADFLRFAALASGLYIAWMIAFERWMEPFARASWSAALGREIRWVPAGGRFRVWGLKDSARTSADALVSVIGMLVVLASAAMPVLAIHWMAPLEAIRAVSYLMSVPMMVGFVLRVLFLKRDDPRA